MKIIFLLSILISSIAHCAELAEIKVCTVLHENKSSHCLTEEKQSFPTTKLLGISKIKRGRKTVELTHTWNGAAPSDVIFLERGRIMISTFQVPQGHSGSLDFVVKDPSGEVVDSRKMEIARGPLSVSANLQKPKKIETAKAPVPVGSKSDDLPALDEMETQGTADTLAVMAKDSGDLPDTTEESLEETRKAVGANSNPPSDISEKLVSPSDDSGLFWRRVEVHGAFVTQSKRGSSYSVLPYYAPEYRSESFWGFGARIGGTEFKQEKGKNITAIEGDVHVSLMMRSSKGRFSLQPAYGYHSWSKFGNNSSYGAMGEIKMNSIPLSILGGVQFWTYKKVDYRLVSVGLGVEF